MQKLMSILVLSGFLIQPCACGADQSNKQQSVEVVQVLPVPVPVIRFIGEHTYILGTALFLYMEHHTMRFNFPTAYKALLYGAGAFGIKTYCQYLLSEHRDISQNQGADHRVLNYIKECGRTMVAYVKQLTTKN